MIRTGLAFLALLALAGCGDDTHDARLRRAGPNPSLDALLRVADAKVGEGKAGPCKACHTFEAGGADLGGPNLHGIYGAPMGRNRPGFGYSAALRDKAGRWDAATLDAWLRHPRALVPGTAMMFDGVPDPLDRADIIVYLKQ